MATHLSGSGGTPLAGHVGTNLGKSGPVKLTELQAKASGQGSTAGAHSAAHSPDAYNRNSGGSGHYLRVNPFMVDHKAAPDPNDSVSGSAPWKLNDWDGYQQWLSGSSSIGGAQGTNFDITAKDEDSFTFAFTYADGYTRDPDSVNQRLYYKKCSTSECVDGSGDPDDPRKSGGSSTAGPADGSTYKLDSLDHSSYYIFCINAEHIPSGSGATAESKPYDCKGAGSPSDCSGLTSFSYGRTRTTYAEAADDGKYLINTTDRPCIAYNVGLGTEINGCSGGEHGNTCDDIVFGGHDAWAREQLGTDTYVFTDSGCSNSLTSTISGSGGWYIAIRTDLTQGQVRTLSAQGQIGGSPNNDCCA